MTWLQERLDELCYTHEDLRQMLQRYGIERSRVAITGWTNGRPIPLLCDAKETEILARVLKWTSLELFMAAGYEVGVNQELITMIQRYNSLKPFQKHLFLLAAQQFMRASSGINKDDVENALRVEV